MRFGSSFLFFLVGALICGAGITVSNFRLQRAPLDLYVQESRSAKVVAQGHAIVFPHGMNEAAFRWDLAAEIPAAPDIIVLGSSHAQLLSRDFFPTQRLWNLAMAGGSLSDDLITFQILDERHCHPRQWYVFADPWLFEEAKPFTPNWMIRPKALAAIDQRLAQPGQSGHFAKDLADFHATQTQAVYQLDPVLAAVDQVVRGWIDRPVIADAAVYHVPIIRADGSMEDQSKRSRSTAEVTALALRQFNEKIDRHRYGTFAEIDSESVRVFENWIRLLRQGDAGVTLVFAPYHPAVYPVATAERNNRLKDVEAIFRRIATDHGCEVVGNYNPAKAGVTPDDFSDGDHLKVVGLKKLFGVLTSQPPPPPEVR